MGGFTSVQTLQSGQALGPVSQRYFRLVSSVRPVLNSKLISLMQVKEIKTDSL